MVPGLVGIKAQHCTAVLFTDYYSELSGYRGFTKEVLVVIVIVLRIIMPILGTFPTYPYSQIKCGGVASNKNFDVLNMMEEELVKA